MRDDCLYRSSTPKRKRPVPENPGAPFPLYKRPRISGVEQNGPHCWIAAVMTMVRHLVPGEERGPSFDRDRPKEWLEERTEIQDAYLQRLKAEHSDDDGSIDDGGFPDLLAHAVAAQYEGIENVPEKIESWQDIKKLQAAERHVAIVAAVTEGQGGHVWAFAYYPNRKQWALHNWGDVIFDPETIEKIDAKLRAEFGAYKYTTLWKAAEAFSEGIPVEASEAIEHVPTDGGDVIESWAAFRVKYGKGRYTLQPVRAEPAIFDTMAALPVLEYRGDKLGHPKHIGWVTEDMFPVTVAVASGSPSAP